MINTKIKSILLNSTYVVILILTMFLSSDLFLNDELLPKWYSLYLLTMLMVGFIIYNKDAAGVKLKIDKVTIALLVFLAYTLFRCLDSSIVSIHIFKLVTFLYLFFIFRRYKKSNHYLPLLIVSISVCEAIVGIVQYFDTGKIIGSFDNVAGYAASLAIAYPLCFILLNKSYKYQRVIGTISMVILLIGLALSGSRAGVLSVVVVSVIYSYKYFVKYKWTYLSISVLLIILSIICLFFLKQDSANGRFLIWRVSMDMYIDNPLFGNDNGGFFANYMSYQADYFANNPNSAFSQLADNTTHPFNEYIGLLIEFGLIGFVFLGILIYRILVGNKIFNPYLLSLISIGVFAFFSYPLNFPFVLFVMAFCLSKLPNNRKGRTVVRYQRIKNETLITIVGILLFFELYLVGQNIYYELGWNKTVSEAHFGKSDKVIDQYQKLYNSLDTMPAFNNNPLFHYNYGVELNRNEYYEKSLKVFMRSQIYYNDYNVQLYIADNYLNLNNYEKAEEHYIRASNMIPNRFVPLELLLNMYDYLGDEKKTADIANKIVNKEVKIPSQRVQNIKENASKYL